MTTDQRIEALTQSVELLASVHRDNAAKLAKLQKALMTGVTAFLKVLAEQEPGELPT